MNLGSYEGKTQDSYNCTTQHPDTHEGQLTLLQLFIVRAGIDDVDEYHHGEERGVRPLGRLLPVQQVLQLHLLLDSSAPGYLLVRGQRICVLLIEVSQLTHVLFNLLVSSHSLQLACFFPLSLIAGDSVAAKSFAS